MLDLLIFSSYWSYYCYWIVDGTLPKTSVKSVSDLKVLTSLLDPSSDNTLYTPLPKKNVSNVDLTSASIVIRKTF